MSRPLVGAAIVVWSVAGALLVAGAVMTIRAPRDAEGQKRLGWSIGLITAAVCLVGLGAVAFLATTGELAGRDLPGEKWVPVTTTLSPIPIAPDAPSITPTQRPATQSRSSDPVEIGFESIGAVEIGGSTRLVAQAFGEPSARESGAIAPDGKPAVGWSYENAGRDFVIYERDGKTVSYEVRSDGFVTFSGVKVGSTASELSNAYPSRLERIENGFFLDGPRGTGVRFEVVNEKVSKIEGGFI